MREALATFERLDAGPASDAAAVELRRRGVRVGPRRGRSAGEPGNPSGLTDRELEVMRLVAAGFTNPQIAAALYISRKTAEHHVSSILVKLGVSLTHRGGDGGRAPRARATVTGSGRHEAVHEIVSPSRWVKWGRCPMCGTADRLMIAA